MSELTFIDELPGSPLRRGGSKSTVARAAELGATSPTTMSDPPLLAVSIGLEPFPMPRPRRAPNGGVYMPKEYKTARDAFRDVLMGVMDLDSLIEGPVVVTMRFVRTALEYVPAAEKRSHRRGDGDNYEKFVLDCCTGVVWADDRQVEACAWSFGEAEHPRTKLQVHACTQHACMHALSP